jgi:hypothetical protein
METKLDELYQLPLEEFTKARNALAKTLSSDAKRVVASLAKPTVPLWAINQLYWKDRSTYKALIDAAEKLRAAHRAVLGGKKVDLRKPDEIHRAALGRAESKAVSLLERAAGRVTDPVRETIRRALAALPSDEQAGRLTREPGPAGFSLLAGVKPRAVKASFTPPKDQKAEREREKSLAAARTQIKNAQQAAERATFAVKKAESELAKARAAEENAASQLQDAERRLAELERE